MTSMPRQPVGIGNPGPATARSPVAAVVARMTAVVAGLMFANQIPEVHAAPGAVGDLNQMGQAGPANASGSTSRGNAAAEASVADYFAAIESLGLIDVDTGNREALRRELGAAEALLSQGAAMEAAVALYTIVESPRFTPFEDFVEYHNAEYDLGIALAIAGAYESALTYLERALARGPESMYFAPAHRRAVDVALETRDYQGVLDRLENVAPGTAGNLPEEVAGERAYLRGRIAYVAGDLNTADRELADISPGSRLYSSSLYLRGVIQTRQGQFDAAATALCEVVDTAEDDARAFLVDGRYFTIKDLARLGLGRIAHEQGEFDDAYYHYFQIPDDSDRLAEALFESAWSMYQKRDLDAARDLLDELFAVFPSAPHIPEAQLLAGYVELADCRFDEALGYYDRLVTELTPVMTELEEARRDADQRRHLFDRALARWRAERADPTRPVTGQAARTPGDKVLSLLRLDPGFVRLHEAVRGLRRAAGDAPHGVRTWTSLGRQIQDTRVRQIATERTIEEEDAADANGLLEDVRRLGDQVENAQAELRRGLREQTLPPAAGAAERERLRALARDVEALEAKLTGAAAAADAAIERAAAPGLRPLIRTDLARARQLERASRRLQARLQRAADDLAQRSLDRLYRDTRRILDKAQLGKIDAVIGQKRALDIQVQDLAAGRFPAELRGRLWEEGLIGDDEVFWPFEGEYWADEYEGWR